MEFLIFLPIRYLFVRWNWVLIYKIQTGHESQIMASVWQTSEDFTWLEALSSLDFISVLTLDNAALITQGYSFLRNKFCDWDLKKSLVLRIFFESLMIDKNCGTNFCDWPLMGFFLWKVIKNKCRKIFLMTVFF